MDILDLLDGKEEDSEDEETAEQKAVSSLTTAVKTHISNLKGIGLGRKTIDSYKSIVRDALGVKRMGDKRYQEIISMCDELEVVTLDSGRSYFKLKEIVVPIKKEPKVNFSNIPTQDEDGVSVWDTLSSSWVSREVQPQWRSYRLEEKAKSDFDKLEEGEVLVGFCPACDSTQLTLYSNSKGLFRCNGCNDLAEGEQNMRK